MNRRVALILGAALAIAAAHALDSHAYNNWAWATPAERDWGRLLRVLGYAPTWLAVALVLWFQGRGQAESKPLVVSARALVFAVVLGGIVSEAAKLLIRRERPNVADGAYQFRSFDIDPFNTSRLGLPSGHTMVAFAGAGALSQRYPRAAPVLLALAAGCGLTRVFAQAHFLSDVVVGALAGGALGGWVARRVGKEAAAG